MWAAVYSEHAWRRLLSAKNFLCVAFGGHHVELFNFGNRQIRQSLNFAMSPRLLLDARPVTASPRAAQHSYKTMGRTGPCPRYHHRDCGVDICT